MRKAHIYILFLLFILHNTALNQLLKLPVLITHFFEHRQGNRDLSVAEFLCMHYNGEKDHDPTDKKLPYKQVDVHTLQHSFVPLAKVIAIRQQEYQPCVINYPVLKDNYLPDPARDALFRPPRA